MNKNNRKEKKDNLNILKFIGPGLLVTVGFIDPGNWASNIAAGSGYGYTLLWMVTLSTIMLIILQHNAAHLGIVTGLCLSEAASRYINRTLKNVILVTAVAAAIATAMAEILGGAIALQMLFHIPIKVGSMLILVVVLFCEFTNAYKRIEKLIMLFVSLIGFCRHRMGKTGISIACDAGYHERAWRGCHAAQSVFTFGDHSEPEVESERRSGDSETIEI